MTEARIPVILCIDCEPDQHVWSLDRPSPWSGFEQMANGSPSLRDRLERTTGLPAHFTWTLRMDPQIALSYGSSAFLPLHFPAFFDSVDRIGDRIGVHVHAWRWDTTETTWVADHEDPNWVSTCVATAYESYRDAFGRTPTLHRFGSRFMSTELMNQVRAEGSSFDLTLEPGEPSELPGLRSGSVWRGVLPDFSAIPRVPYRPERSDFRRVGVSPGDDSFLAVPLSSGRYIAAQPPPRAATRLAHPMRTASGAVRRLRQHSARLADRASGNRRPPYRLLAMWRDWRSPTDFWNSAFAAADDLERPYLAFAVRSSTGVRADLADRFNAIMDALGDDPRAKRLTFTTLDRASGLLH